jgi:hypothetical protein
MSLDIHDLETIQTEAKIIGAKLDQLSDRQNETNRLLNLIANELVRLNTTVKNEPWTVVKE